MIVDYYCPIKIGGCKLSSINLASVLKDGLIANNLHPYLPNRQALGSRKNKLLLINPKGRHINLKIYATP